MIKAFAPMLGAFKGDGKLADGTELQGRLRSEEALADVAYSFRAEMTDDAGNKLLDAFFVLSEAQGGRMQMQFYEMREHVHALAWDPAEGNKGDTALHIYRFFGRRDNGTEVRITFTLTSAEKAEVRFESLGRRGDWREHWGMRLDRVHERAAEDPRLKAA